MQQYLPKPRDDILSRGLLFRILQAQISPNRFNNFGEASSYSILA